MSKQYGTTTDAGEVPIIENETYTTNLIITTTDNTVPMIINNGSTIVEYHDREQYEKDLKKKQEEHMKRVREFQDQQNPSYPISEPPVEPWQPCLHDSCSECHGTGLKYDGSMCVHMISCTCPKCSTYC